MRPDLDLVIFDCDGVLVDSEPLALQLNVEMLAELGWHPSGEEIIDLFLGKSLPACVAIIEEHTGAPLPVGWADRFRDRITAAHEAHLTEVDGVREALAEIAGWGVPVCVASSGWPGKIRHSLTLVGLADVFGEHIFSALQVAHGKPAPDLFLLAAATLGARPERCAVVEDSRYGVEAARAAGMYAYGYAGGLTPTEWLEGPRTTVFTDMRKLPGLLAEPR